MKVFSFPERHPVYPGPIRLRCILFCLVLLACLFRPQSLKAQSAPLYFTPIPYSDPDIISPGRGAEQWENGSESVNYPLADTLYRSMDVYCRFPWTRIEDSIVGKYNWTFFDGLVKDAIDKGQKLSFGIMPVYDGEGTTFYDSAKSAYPLYLHRTMQSGAVNTRDWISNGVWIPNWNHSYYLSRLKALNSAINNHILATSYKGIPFRNAIYCIDIRGYGNYGEWHNAGIVEHVRDYPPGRQATPATLKAIISHHTTVFKNWPLTLMIAAFDAGQYDAIMTPAEVTHFALTTKNAWGPLGWRRDQWGATDPYLDKLLKDNDKSFGNSQPFKELITTRYLTSPVTGEPPRYINPGGPCDYWDLERQLTEYGATSMGNGNWGKKLSGCGAENARAAFKKAGYRIILESGSISNIIRPGQLFDISLAWKNIGIAPTYELWDVWFELKNDNNEVVWSQMSKFKPKLFAPGEQATTIVDDLRMGADIAPGQYDLQMVIRDPAGYRKPLPLAIKGRNEDGGYTLKRITVSPAECIPPVATLRAIEPCSEEQAKLILDSASGISPFDLMINGTLFENVTPGQEFANLTAPIEMLWPEKPNASSYIDAPVELGLKFKTKIDGIIKGIRFFSPHEPTGTYTGHFWTIDGRLIDSVVFSGVKPDAWQEAFFTTPIQIKADSVYLVSYHSSAGYYASTPAGLKSAVANGSLIVTSENENGGNGVYNYGDSPTFPTQSYNASNYWVDVLFSPAQFNYTLNSVTDANGCSNAGTLQSIVVNFQKNCDQPADTVNKTLSAALKATPACTGNFDVILDSANGAGPYDLVINGKNYQNISPGDTIIKIGPPVQSIWDDNPAPGNYIDAPVELGLRFMVTQTGRINGIRFFSPNEPSGVYTGHLWTSGGQLLQAVEFKNITPNSWQEALFTQPVTVYADSIYIVSYHTEGHYASTPEGLSSSFTSGSLVVPSDSSAGANGLYSYGPSGSFPTHSYHSSNYWADVVFVPDSTIEYTFNLTSISDKTGAINSGSLHTLTVQASQDCDTTAQEQTPSAQIGYLADCGNPSFSLVLDSADGMAPYDLVINGVLYKDIMPGQTITTISPAAVSIWNGIPAAVSAEDQPVELGMKFRSSSAGFVKGIRFFSPANAEGIYTGRLWTVSGTLLDSAVFTNITPSGWQEVLFNEPVYIFADSIYIASYHTSAGRYSATTGGLKQAAAGSYLTALADSIAGGNGVFHYGATGGFPDMTYNANNYWVDVLFVADTTYDFTFDLTVITDKTGATKTGALQTLSVSSPGCPEEKTVTQNKNSTPPVVATVKETVHTEGPEAFYALEQNRPNPFGNKTNISYVLANPGMVNLILYDIYGRLVKVMVHEWKEAGRHTVGMEKGMLPGGIYFYKIQAGNFSAVKKLIIQ